MNELQQLRDENTQLQTALTIKNGTIEQLKARLAELAKQLEIKAFEEWLNREKPSGDADNIHAQWRESIEYEELNLDLQQAPAKQMPEGFRVMKPTSAIVRDGDKWEIYAPCGSGGIVREDEVSSWVVKNLLDSLAAAPQAETLNQCDGCRAGVPLTNGIHHMGKPGGYPDPMACTAHLYKAERFCEGHCTWLDHHPNCEIGKTGQAGGES